MVASPEVCRQNGRKSKGAKTERGKAISSRNATKHGLLAQKPPLLISEDLATFEGIVQGLIDYYQPTSPVEHFLIQQVAMGILKQYRLWSVEAAIANIEILKRERARKFPDIVQPPEKILSAGLERYHEKRIPLKTYLEQEKQNLIRLIDNLEDNLANTENEGYSETLSNIEDSLNYKPYQAARDEPIDHYVDELSDWISSIRDAQHDELSQTDWDGLCDRVRELIQQSHKRIAEIDLKLDEIQRHSDTVAQEVTLSLSIQEPERYERYQRNINRDLYAAMDRLDAIAQQRQEGHSMGSFGQKTNLAGDATINFHEED